MNYVGSQRLPHGRFAILSSKSLESATIYPPRGDGIVYTIYNPAKPAIGFHFEIIFNNEGIYIKYVDLPEFSEKGIIKAMVYAISNDLKMNIYSSTNKGKKLYNSEGIVDEMRGFWSKFKRENQQVTYLENDDRYIYICI